MLLDTFPALLAAAIAASRAKLCIDPAICIHSLWRGECQITISVLFADNGQQTWQQM